MAEVVVLDLETTGAGAHDRIIEVAGIIYETDGDYVVGEFETLVNPLRSVTTDISLKTHNLTAEHLSAAPTFQEVGPWLARLLHRRPMVHHSSGFDNRMLNQEFIWSGIDFRVSQVASTMRQAEGLASASAQIGYKLVDHHSAITDARAALAIAKSIGWEQLLANAGRNEHLASHIQVSSHRTFSRFQAGLSKTFDLVRFSRGTEFKDLTPEDEYLFLLDELLEDMRLSAEEIAVLEEFAESKRMTTSQIRELNQRYLANIETAVLRNGYVSVGELSLVSQFAELLGVEPTITLTERGDINLEPGALISATSTAVIDGKELSKEELGQVLADLGYVFSEQFRKRDNPALLLVPTEGHISSKTKQAMQWGVPQMTVSNFLDKFGSR